VKISEALSDQNANPSISNDNNNDGCITVPENIGTRYRRCGKYRKRMLEQTVDRDVASEIEREYRLFNYGIL